MKSCARSASTTAAVAAGLLLASAGAGLAADRPVSSSGSSHSALAAAPTTMNYYSVGTLSNLYTSNGQVVTDPNTPPALGDYLVSTDNDYLGTQASHGAEVTATDHLYCIFTAAPATATCSAEIATSQGMLLADNSVQDFASQGQTQTFDITGGTGAYQGATGTVVVTPIQGGNNSEFTVTWSG